MCRITACEGFVSFAKDLMKSIIDPDSDSFRDIGVAVIEAHNNKGVLKLRGCLAEFINEFYGKPVDMNFLPDGAVSLFYETDDGYWLLIDNYTVDSDVPGRAWEFDIVEQYSDIKRAFYKRSSEVYDNALSDEISLVAL